MIKKGPLTSHNLWKNYKSCPYSEDLKRKIKNLSLN